MAKYSKNDIIRIVDEEDIEFIRSTQTLSKMPRIVLSATFHSSHQVKSWMLSL